MRIVKAVVFSLGALALCAFLTPRSNADPWNKKTVVTFSDSVEIPGQVLPPGTYVFKLAPSISDRHIVQIWTGDESQLITTTLTIPDYRPEPSEVPTFEFDERPVGEPMALHSWFYPGETTGQQFLYPGY
jgi:hypothetical protein